MANSDNGKIKYVKIDYNKICKKKKKKKERKKKRGRERERFYQLVLMINRIYE